MYGRDHALERIAGHHRRGSGFAPTDHAIVGLDPHQHIIGAPDFLARHDDGLEHRQADRDRLDGFDLHADYLGPTADLIATAPAIDFGESGRI